jgi:hypothetical protein
VDKPFIIMLDLDGPVCTHRARNGTGDDFDPVAGGMIAKVCRDTGARIVIVSARRRDDDLPDALSRLGLSDHLFDHPDHWRTGHDPRGIRGNEVDAWHDANPGHRYALVDDERGGYAPHHIARLVHTDMHAGLSLKDVYRLKRLMGHTVKDSTIDDADAQAPRITLAQHARDALDALDQGDDDRARALLAIIADHPLSQ